MKNDGTWSEKYQICDLDSSDFKIKDSKTLDSKKYIAEIKKKAGIQGAIVLISTHQETRRECAEAGVKYSRVFPANIPGAKEEWLKREENRNGKESNLWKAMDSHWRKLMEIDNGSQAFTGEDDYSPKHSLNKGKYLSHIIGHVIGRSKEFAAERSGVTIGQDSRSN
ncbi:hypothetical protein N8I77_009907 [Diaporthe amygdali]|nr:hypothetical protein N8I77_009907 [Diaporthe amygdali]